MIRPLRGKILVKTILPVESKHGLVVPEFYQEPEPEGTVLAVGAGVQDIIAGNYVRYERYHEKWAGPREDRLAIIDERHVIAVVEPGCCSGD